MEDKGNIQRAKRIGGLHALVITAIGLLIWLTSLLVGSQTSPMDLRFNQTMSISLVSLVLFNLSWFLGRKLAVNLLETRSLSIVKGMVIHFVILVVGSLVSAVPMYVHGFGLDLFRGDFEESFFPIVLITIFLGVVPVSLLGGLSGWLTHQAIKRNRGFHLFCEA